MKNFGPQTWLIPMPVLVIGTYNDDGSTNAMTAAWGSAYDYKMITISLGKHKTTDNLEKRKFFTVGFATEETMMASDYVGIVSADEVKNKMEKSGLTAIKSEFVNAPLFKEFPLSLECEVESFENGTLIGKIINVCAREDVIGEDGLPDMEKIKPIIFDPVHAKYMKTGEVIGDAFVIGNTIK